MTDQTKPIHQAEVLHYQLFDELVLYRPGIAQAASLNESARAIWELCDGTRTIEEICIELARAVGVEAADLREDVRKGVIHLRDLGMLSCDV